MPSAPPAGSSCATLETVFPEPCTRCATLETVFPEPRTRCATLETVFPEPRIRCATLETDFPEPRIRCATLETDFPGLARARRIGTARMAYSRAAGQRMRMAIETGMKRGGFCAGAGRLLRRLSIAAWRLIEEFGYAFAAGATCRQRPSRTLRREAGGAWCRAGARQPGRAGRSGRRDGGGSAGGRGTTRDELFVVLERRGRCGDWYAGRGEGFSPCPIDGSGMLKSRQRRRRVSFGDTTDFVGGQDVPGRDSPKND